ncbi:MAG TPA: amino acid permease [Stackebrandtia sp.]|uniref:amino acid permease n=1 Tax=Stackebrandtia sp. TaxID=2023065 RepID=UPI002D562789|nr:amino acid permease [Stackebrandtia sp.]HZE37650.1 amino acid permease [Stackebrandtia sp.]
MSTPIIEAPPATTTHGSLGLGRGTALFLGSVLGPGVLALPRLAAHAAGPASIVAWVGLLLLSVPVSFTFAALGARYPGAGGMSAFAKRAFGQRSSVVVGWWFYFLIPVGTPAAAFVGAEYVASPWRLGHGATVAIALGFVVAAFGLNHLGLRLSGGAQMLLMALLIILLVTAVAVASPHLHAANFTPFAPHGVGGILAAVAVLYFGFAGGEAVAHLSGEFRDPAHQLPRVTATTLAIIAVIYIGLSVVVVGALGGAAGSSPVPITDLLAFGLGGAAPLVTAVAAAVLTLGVMNVFIASASRLGAVLARDGALPRVLAGGHEPGRIPHRSLLLLAGLALVTTTVASIWRLDLDTLMRLASGCLAAVSVVGTACGVRLLPGRLAKTLAAVSTVLTCVVLVSLGWTLLVPLVIGAAALCYARFR